MSDRNEELRVALGAVRAASRICRAVQAGSVDPNTIEKQDRSPVTVADFASQAVVCGLLEEALPEDPVVGEENADALRASGNEVARLAVVDHVVAEIGDGTDERRVLDWIDRGGADAHANRFWTVDPIDGTKGFLRGDQYAVALALIEDGEVVLGVLGCPNLPDASGGRGGLFAATAGSPTHSYALWDDADVRGSAVSVQPVTAPSEARFCESVESGHSNQSASAEIAQYLGIKTEPFRIDSQCKYAAVARGDASIYLRMPTRKDYREKIWDHAAGKIVVESAGGTVTDANGRTLDFRKGRTLEDNRGIVATAGAIHAAVIEAVQRVQGAA